MLGYSDTDGVDALCQEMLESALGCIHLLGEKALDIILTRFAVSLLCKVQIDYLVFIHQNYFFIF